MSLAAEIYKKLKEREENVRQLSERQKAVDKYLCNEYHLFDYNGEAEIPIKLNSWHACKQIKVDLGNGMYLTEDDLKDFADRYNLRYIAPDKEHVFPTLSFD